MKVTFKGKEVKLIGIPPKVGDSMPNFTVLNKDKHTVTKDNLLGKVSLISVVPDINTPVCSIQTKTFNKKMDQFPNINFLTISTNTIQDQQNWCAAEDVKNMQLLSDENLFFGKATGLLIPDSGILARSVWILDPNGKIVYREIVDKITHEPDAALNELKKLM
ncbi:thiol peroxidase [Lactobacillus gasseri]|uniref:thiol peroxidase n=1 Tax=Lactobacillus gasseri TaxID=1596 RepID=UPI000E430132|nr:thiol peroxidase [Lactobacillus gasseri]MCZ3947015.1 thiol peroxidase [Lactobacillus gasseri]RGL16907.1 thiol peroxidase [Lactobacillus gasseri]